MTVYVHYKPGSHIFQIRAKPIRITLSGAKIKTLKMKFPFYILERNVADFEFFQHKKDFKHLKGPYTLYKIEGDMNIGNFNDDLMGCMSHDHVD